MVSRIPRRQSIELSAAAQREKGVKVNFQPLSIQCSCNPHSLAHIERQMMSQPPSVLGMVSKMIPLE